jgi:hypothetical protein
MKTQVELIRGQRAGLDAKFAREFPNGKMSIYYIVKDGKKIWFADIDKARPVGSVKKVSNHLQFDKNGQRERSWFVYTYKMGKKVFSDVTEFIKACKEVGINIEVINE